MSDNLLQMVQTACDELGLQRPSVVATTSDLQTRQLFALINRDLREIQQNYEWTALQREFCLHVSQPVLTTGTLAVNGYQIIEIPDTSFLLPDPTTWVVANPGLPVAARVASVDSATQVTVTEPATANVTEGDFSDDFSSDFLQGSAPEIVFAKDTYRGPADFDRYINQTWWDRTNHWALMGPDSPQVDQWHRSGIVSIGPRRHFRQVGFVPSDLVQSVSVGRTNYRLWPPPGAMDTPLNIAFEYISNTPVYSQPTDGSAPVAQRKFQADTDICVLDTEMMVLGVKWRMWQIKGFDYAAMQQEYQDYIDRRFAYNGGAKTLSLTKSRYGGSTAMVPDGNWPGPVGADEI